jgi:hypothetical protein
MGLPIRDYPCPLGLIVTAGECPCTGRYSSNRDLDFRIRA